MSEERVITEQELHTNPTLAMAVNPDSELKKFLVEYTGNKLNPEEAEVTVNMIAEVIATDFPEFAFAYAEENFLRGYKLGLEDAQGLHTTETNTADGTTD